MVFFFQLKKKFIFIEKEIGSLQIGSDTRGKNGVEVVQCRPVGGEVSQLESLHIYF